jgi:hypothetical protein
MSQKTDAQLIIDANVIRDETTPGANTKERVRNHTVDIVDSKINNDLIDTADALDTVGKTIPGRDAVKQYIADVLGGVGNLSAEDIDTLAEINAILTDADLVSQADITATMANVTLANGVTAVNWAAGDIQVITISEDKIINSITSPVLGETIVLILDGTFDFEFSTIDATISGEFNAGEENIVYITCLNVTGTPKYHISYANSLGGTGGGTTNLGATLSASNVIITSDTGTDATIPAVDGTNAGVMTPTQKTKLDGIATGATANDTDANLKNRANHTGTQTASTISDFNTAALAAAPAETTATEGALINGATAKSTPVDADFIGLMDSAASNILKKLSWANIKATLKTWIEATTFSTLTGTAVKVAGQAASAATKNPLNIDDTGTVTKTSFVEVDTTNKKITQNGSDDSDATVQHEWKNQSGTWIMRVLNGTKVSFNGSASFLEVQSGVSSGNAGIIIPDDLDISYRLKDSASFDYVVLKSSDGGYGKAAIIKQKQVNDEGAGFETIRRQFKLTLPNTTAAASHIVGSITVASGFAVKVVVRLALAFATNGNVISTVSPFGATLKNSAGTTSAATITAPTMERITATTGGFSIVANDTTDTADITFTNETGTGRQYDVVVDVEYISYPIPV